MYADDISMSLQSRDISQSNMALKLLNTWMQGNKLSLNVVNTESMLVCTKSKRNSIHSAEMKLGLNICGNELEVVTKIKYL